MQTPLQRRRARICAGWSDMRGAALQVFQQQTALQAARQATKERSARQAAQGQAALQAAQEQAARHAAQRSALQAAEEQAARHAVQEQAAAQQQAARQAAQQHAARHAAHQVTQERSARQAALQTAQEHAACTGRKFRIDTSRNQVLLFNKYESVSTLLPPDIRKANKSKRKSAKKIQKAETAVNMIVPPQALLGSKEQENVVVAECVVETPIQRRARRAWGGEQTLVHL